MPWPYLCFPDNENISPPVKFCACSKRIRVGPLTRLCVFNSNFALPSKEIVET